MTNVLVVLICIMEAVLAAQINQQDVLLVHRVLVPAVVQDII